MGVLTGLTLYAKYGQCDLFSTGAIKTDDQMVPYFLMEVAGSVPGLPGLFTVGVVSAGLRYAQFDNRQLRSMQHEPFQHPFRGLEFYGGYAVQGLHFEVHAERYDRENGELHL